jgi:hypothetical protein
LNRSKQIDADASRGRANITQPRRFTREVKKNF